MVLVRPRRSFWIRDSLLSTAVNIFDIDGIVVRQSVTTEYAMILDPGAMNVRNAAS
jgi:hypothetical protein